MTSGGSVATPVTIGRAAAVERHRWSVGDGQPLPPVVDDPSSIERPVWFATGRVNSLSRPGR